MKYDAYFIDGLENEAIWKKLLPRIIAFSDSFSFTTFKYNYHEKNSPGVAKIKKVLSKAKIGSRVVNKWPSTELLGKQKHIYRMDLFRIRLVDMDSVFSAFDEVGSLWNWDYPAYPMDPCFYKNGFAWFVVSTHENWCQIFLKEDIALKKEDIEATGVTLVSEGEVDESRLFKLDDEWLTLSEESVPAEKKNKAAAVDIDTTIVSIDQIMDMLDWNNPSDIQAKGCELARSVKSINVFLQPANPGHVKNVWDNCAIILAERSDKELEPYLDQLFHWLEDMNWPGAECIFNRMKKYQRDSFFESSLLRCIQIARVLNDEPWLETLLSLNSAATGTATGRTN